MGKELGKWAFLIGLIVALIIGIATGVGQSLGGAHEWLILLLVVLGLVIGFVNITAKETTPFLIAAIALLVASTANLAQINTLIPYLGTILSGIVIYLLMMVAPAALIVSVKAFYEYAKA